MARFLVIGVLTVLVDFAAYRLLLAIAMPLTLAKAIGFVAGTIFAYFANRHWTFAATTARRGSALRFAALYAATLGINVAANAGILHLLHGAPSDVSIPLAFIGATGLTAVLNFVGMKLFVFSPAVSLQAHR